jgi:hypothetical protein
MWGARPIEVKILKRDVNDLTYITCSNNNTKASQNTHNNMWALDNFRSLTLPKLKSKHM